MPRHETCYCFQASCPICFPVPLQASAEPAAQPNPATSSSSTTGTCFCFQRNCNICFPPFPEAAHAETQTLQSTSTSFWQKELQKDWAGFFNESDALYFRVRLLERVVLGCFSFPGLSGLFAGFSLRVTKKSEDRNQESETRRGTDAADPLKQVWCCLPRTTPDFCQQPHLAAGRRYQRIARN